MKKNAKTKTQLLLEIDELRTRLEVAEETLRTLQGGDKVTLKEIAHLKKANETFAQLASFPELNPNPIMEIDLAGNVYYLNPAAKQLFPDLQTTGPHHPSLSDLSSLIEMFKHQGKSSIIRELKINDSWYEQAIYYVSENNRLRIYGRDITDRKRTDETLQNALKETDQRRAEISALLEASRAVLENRKFKDAARAIFDSCKNLIGANAGYVALLTKDGTENEVLFLDSGGLRCTVDPNLPMPIRGLREEAYRTGKAVFHNDFPSSGYMKYMPEGHVNLNNVLFAPLAISGKVIGLLGLANKPRGFTENDARMASALGELAAVALHNSRTLESLETSEKHFRSVVQTANDAIISIDKQGNIIFWNNSAENVFGYSTNEVTGKPVTFIIPERFRQIHQKAIHQVVSTDKSNLIGKTIEMTGLKKDCNEFPLELSLATWGAGEEIFFTGILRDITERKRMEEELRKSRDELEIRVQERTAELMSVVEALQDEMAERKQTEEELRDISLYARSLIEASLDPLVTISRGGKIMDVNSATELVTGLSRDHLIGSDFSDYFTEPEKAKEGYKEVLLKGFVRDYPLSIRHTSGRTTDVLYNAALYKNEVGEMQGIFAAARDISERKRAEEALRESENRLRSLSSQLLTVQENERKRIAMELHDGIGQLLTAVKFKVESILQVKGKGKAKAKEESLEAIIPMVKESVEEVRRIQMDLRPSTLDDLGILATLGWFCREYQKIYSRIRVQKEIDHQESEVSTPLKTVIYRVMQEALNNIAKHSKADLVYLSLRKKENKIELTIKDTGMGFDLEEILSPERSKRGLGLNSMRERTELSGGTFVIESTAGKGTTIRAEWPIS
ncbi:MAG: PAS domain S-box protein [Thermodesulfobacteriota bacterium]|jgi:PAS domain S-box-containing protein